MRAEWTANLVSTVYTQPCTLWTTSVTSGHVPSQTTSQEQHTLNLSSSWWARLEFDPILSRSATLKNACCNKNLMVSTSGFFKPKNWLGHPESCFVLLSRIFKGYQSVPKIFHLILKIEAMASTYIISRLVTYEIRGLERYPVKAWEHISADVSVNSPQKCLI